MTEALNRVLLSEEIEALMALAANGRLSLDETFDSARRVCAPLYARIAALEALLREVDVVTDSSGLQVNLCDQWDDPCDWVNRRDFLLAGGAADES